jgi:hypothetical protein
MEISQRDYAVLNQLHFYHGFLFVQVANAPDGDDRPTLESNIKQLLVNQPSYLDESTKDYLIRYLAAHYSELEEDRLWALMSIIHAAYGDYSYMMSYIQEAKLLNRDIMQWFVLMEEQEKKEQPCSIGSH